MYKLTCEGLTVLLPDEGFVIPAYPGNADYCRYREWLAAGNTPEPADPLPNPRMAEIKALLAAIDAKKIRPASELAIAVASAGEVSAETIETLRELEAKSVPLRYELRGLTGA